MNIETFVNEINDKKRGKYEIYMFDVIDKLPRVSPVIIPGGYTVIDVILSKRAIKNRIYVNENLKVIDEKTKNSFLYKINYTYMFQIDKLLSDFKTEIDIDENITELIKKNIKQAKISYIIDTSHPLYYEGNYKDTLNVAGVDIKILENVLKNK